ncbi:hypothetical protein Dsin_003295 [Dipteronia sinensis]|uniref:Reverse transcriptase zinc-binding domain-containing protein n=1 Tax=Dipteronia sinensis TaxID=43782 RepID=A0AAE0EKH8_9ROSI|nr:hypothetical protein Dsin_003295 [Dipteronia sinensis]
MKRKVHAVNWDSICKSKSLGGLGIDKMEDKNSSLLAKWIWRFGSENNLLWRRVICEKYGVPMKALKWDWKEDCSPSPFVKAMASLLIEGSVSKKVLRSVFKDVIGNENKSLFWDIDTRESGKLRSACPRIYALAISKQGVISDFGKWIGSQWIWEVPLRRPLFDWKKEQWSVFLSCLDNIIIRNFVPDILAWVNMLDGKFSVGSFRKSMEDGSMTNVGEHKLLWQEVSPPKVEILVWQLLRGRVMVRKVLQRCGPNPLAFILCPLCDHEEEGVNHIFLHCGWSWKLWTQCMAWWDVCQILGGLVVQALRERDQIPCHNDALKSEGKLHFGSDKAAKLCSQSVSLRDKEIDIVSDSSEAVSWVNTEGLGNLEYLHIIYEIRHSLSRMGNTKVIYNPRSSNSLADSLTKHGSALKGDKMI